MWSKIVILSSLFMSTFGEITVPGIDRTVSDGVSSAGYRIIYGDEDLTVLNTVVDDLEKDVLKRKINLNEALPPLRSEDVKCLMSVDKYCSKDMGQVKGVIIEAIRNDCGKCTTEQKERAGKVIASLMAHDPVAWKLFLTRFVIQSKPPEEAPKQEMKFRLVGEPQDVVRSKIRYARPGVKVRVKRYKAMKL